MQLSVKAVQFSVWQKAKIKKGAQVRQSTHEKHAHELDIF